MRPATGDAGVPLEPALVLPFSEADPPKSVPALSLMLQNMIHPSRFMRYIDHPSITAVGTRQTTRVYNHGTFVNVSAAPTALARTFVLAPTAGRDVYTASIVVRD